MTFDPDRRRDIDDPIRQRMLDGESGGWAPGLVAIALLALFAYLIFANFGTSPQTTTRESSAQTERTAPAAPSPKVPK